MQLSIVIIDVQPSVTPPQWLIVGTQILIGTLPSVATVERHDESKTPIQKQLDWHPAPDDDNLIQADRLFIKHGYAPSLETIEYLKRLEVDRVFVCGLQTETYCLAAGFALFDAGLQLTLITDLTVGSSLDRTGELGVRLWQHHFKHTVEVSKV